MVTFLGSRQTDEDEEESLLDNVSVTTILRDSFGDITEKNVSSVFFGTLAPGEESEVLILDMRVFGVTDIGDVKLGIVNADIGSADISEVLFMSHSSTIGGLTDPTTPFPSINESGSSTDEGNLSVGQRSSKESEFIALKAIGPEKPASIGRISVKWFFDFAVSTDEQSSSSSSSSSQSVSAPEQQSNKKILSVAIDAYPDIVNTLDSSLNSVEAWVSVLTSEYGFSDPTELTDSQATVSGIKAALTSFIANAVSGDSLVFLYAGHGWVALDTDGDEPDTIDESLFVYDGVLLDDEIADIIKDVPDDVQLTVIFDSSYSGINLRAK
jgi:hypothetical protein